MQAFNGKEIPEWLAKVEERIFGGLSPEEGLSFRKDFISYINNYFDLETIKRSFLIIVLESVLGSFDHKYYKVKQLICLVIHLLKHETTRSEEFKIVNTTAAHIVAYSDIDNAAAYAAATAAYAASVILDATYIDSAVYAAAYSDTISCSQIKYSYLSKELLKLLANTNAFSEDRK